MDLFVIKQILRLVGITDLVVRFDDPNRQIIATFTKDSQGHTEFIKFTDIEKLFTEQPFQAHTAPLIEETTPGGEL